MNKIELDKIFNHTEIIKISELLVQDKYKELKEWLNSPEVSQKLKEKGIYPDYIYYGLYYFNEMEG